MLNIKEIFESDLDPNSPIWWSKDKVDKINFNFSQLKEGGPYGPRGIQGIDGLSGSIGDTGIQGIDGNQGPQGISGEDGKILWNLTDLNNAYYTISPRYQESNIEYSPISIAIGSTDDNITIPSGETPESTTAIIYNDGIKNNLSISNNYGRGSIKTEISGNNLIASIGEISSTSSSTSLELREVVPTGGRVYKNDAGDFLEVTVNNNNELLTSHVDAVFEQPNNSDINYNNVTHDTNTDNFSYNNNALEKKVLISADADGNLEWKNRYEVFSALPRGSFISIREEDFNNTNFNITDGSEVGNDGYLRVGYGRGKLGSAFEGWYIANGQRWTDGVLEFEVPNLNSFNYTISGTGNSTATLGEDYDIVIPNPNPIIIAGCGVELDGDYNTTSLEYDVSHIVTLDDESISIPGIPGPSDVSIKRNVNIIKLGEDSLYWLNNASTVVSTFLIQLAFGNNITSACNGTPSPYFWTNDPQSNNWDDTPTSGESLYTYNNGSPGATPDPGWYQLGGTTRYWNGSSFDTQTDVCPITYIKQLVTSSTLMSDDINGASITGSVSAVSFNIDTELFKDATSIAYSGTGTIPGPMWIREFGTGANTYRRYWNGSSFEGESIDKLYVNVPGSNYVKASNLNNSSVCDSSSDSIIFYYAHDWDPSTITIVYTHDIDKIYDNNTLNDKSVIYVNKNWSSGIGNNPVAKIRNQNRPGSSSTYFSLIEDPGTIKKYTIVNTLSGIGQPNVCNNTLYFEDPAFSNQSVDSSNQIGLLNAHLTGSSVSSQTISYKIEYIGRAYTSIFNNATVKYNGTSVSPGFNVTRSTTLTSNGLDIDLLNFYMVGSDSNQITFKITLLSANVDAVPSNGAEEFYMYLQYPGS